MNSWWNIRAHGGEGDIFQNFNRVEYFQYLTAIVDESYTNVRGVHIVILVDYLSLFCSKYVIGE